MMPLCAILAGCVVESSREEIRPITDEHGSVIAEPNFRAGDKLTIVGDAPASIPLRDLTVTWQATVRGPHCEREITPPALVAKGFGIGPVLRSFTVRIPAKRDLDGKYRWTIFRDAFVPGECGWTWQEIGFEFDRHPLRVSEFMDPRFALNCAVLGPCQPNNWSSNDDASKPVFHYCKFSYEPTPRPGVFESWNPCIGAFKEHFQTDQGKSEHVLLPSQHEIHFILVDLDASLG